MNGFEFILVYIFILTILFISCACKINKQDKKIRKLNKIIDSLKQDINFNRMVSKNETT